MIQIQNLNTLFKKSFSALKDLHLVEGDGFTGQMLKLPDDDELEK